MHRLKWLLPLALFVPVLMAPSGGYPSNPTFQSVSVNNLTGGVIQATSTASAVDVSLRFDVPATDGFYIGSNSSGSTNAIGAVTGSDYMLTNQARPICIGNSSACRINIAGAGAVAISSALTLTGNAQQPMVAFDANLVVSPTVGTCFHCQASPTATRNSIGNYTILPQSVGNYLWSCTYRNNSSAPGTIGINSTTTGGLSVLTFNAAGSLADQGTVECVGVS